MTKRLMFVNDANETTVDEYPVIVTEAEDQIDFNMSTTFDATADLLVDATSSFIGQQNFKGGMHYDGLDYGELSGVTEVSLDTYYHSYDTGAIDLDLTIPSTGTGAMIIIHYWKKNGVGNINITPVAGDSVTLLTAGSFVEYCYTPLAAGGNGWKALFVHHV